MKIKWEVHGYALASQVMQYCRVGQLLETEKML